MLANVLINDRPEITKFEKEDEDEISYVKYNTRLYNKFRRSIEPIEQSIIYINGSWNIRTSEHWAILGEKM